MEERITRGKAIRLKCLDCCGGSKKDVKQCNEVGCPLHPFRFGTDPYRAKTEISPERREQMRQNMAVANSKRKIYEGKNENLISEG